VENRRGQRSRLIVAEDPARRRLCYSIEDRIVPLLYILLLFFFGSLLLLLLLSLSLSLSLDPKDAERARGLVFPEGDIKLRDKLLRVFTLNRLSAPRELAGILSLSLSPVKARDKHLRARTIGVSQASTWRRTDIRAQYG